MQRSKLNTQKMRGLVDPYTLGFLISLIGASITYIAHSDDQPDSATGETSQMESQVVAPPPVKSE